MDDGGVILAGNFGQTDRPAKHVSSAILAIITYVRMSYFKVTSRISEVLLKYFGSDEVLLLK